MKVMSDEGDQRSDEDERRKTECWQPRGRSRQTTKIYMRKDVQNFEQRKVAVKHPYLSRKLSRPQF